MQCVDRLERSLTAPDDHDPLRRGLDHDAPEPGSAKKALRPNGARRRMAQGAKAEITRSASVSLVA